MHGLIRLLVRVVFGARMWWWMSQAWLLLSWSFYTNWENQLKMDRVAVGRKQVWRKQQSDARSSRGGSLSWGAKAPAFTLMSLTLPVTTLYPPWTVRTGSVIFTLVPPVPDRVLYMQEGSNQNLCHELVSCLVMASGWLGLYQFPSGGWGTEDECPFMCHSGGCFQLFNSIHACWVVFLNFISPSFKIPFIGNSLAVQWLGLGALTAGAPGSIPGWETKIP